MKSNIRKDETIENGDFLSAERISLVGSSSEFRKLSKFFSEIAEEIDKHASDFGHSHLIDSKFSIDTDFDIVAIKE